MLKTPHKINHHYKCFVMHKKTRKYAYDSNIIVMTYLYVAVRCTIISAIILSFTLSFDQTYRITRSNIVKVYNIMLYLLSTTSLQMWCTHTSNSNRECKQRNIYYYIVCYCRHRKRSHNIIYEYIILHVPIQHVAISAEIQYASLSVYYYYYFISHSFGSERIFLRNYIRTMVYTYCTSAIIIIPHIHI